MDDFPDELNELGGDQNGLNNAVSRQQQLDAAPKNQQLSQLLSSNTVPSSQTSVSTNLPHGVIGSLGSSLSGLTPNQQLHSTANASLARGTVSSAAAVTHGVHGSNAVFSNVGTNNISMVGNMSMAGAMNQQLPVVNQNLMNQQHMPHMNGPQMTTQTRQPNIPNVLSSFNTTSQLAGRSMPGQNLGSALQNQQSLVSGLGQLGGQQLGRVSKRYFPFFLDTKR